MLLEIMVAAVLGISFLNAWTCILMCFGTSAEYRSVGKWFIVGRFLGLMVLGSVISSLRFAAQDATPTILLIFGISTVIFGLFMIFKLSIKTYFSKRASAHTLKKSPRDYIMVSLLSLFMVIPGNRKGKRFKNKYRNHTGCDDHIHRKRGRCKKQGFERKYGFALGVFRGATPCAKVIVIAPLLVAVGFPSSLLIMGVYASASTIYPIIGYLSADLFSKFEKHQIALKVIGALILITIGVYSIINVVMWDSTHLGT